MKKLLLFLLICSASAGYGQVLLSENFNTPLIPGWTITDGGSGPQTWTVTFNGHMGNSIYLDGTEFIIVDSDQGGATENLLEILTSPVMTGVPGITLLEFDQFYFWYDFDTGYVDVFDGSVWVNVAKYYTVLGNWFTPDHQVIDISPYSNPAMQVRFRYEDNTTWAWWWAIDNVTVTVYTADDLSADAILSPKTDCGLGIENIEIAISNVALNPQTNIPLKYRINGGAIITDTLFGTLNSGDTAHFLFAVPYDFSSIGGYLIEAWTALPADLSSANDTVSAYILSANTPVIMNIFTGDFSSEISWVIEDSATGMTVHSSSPYFINNAYYSDTFCLVGQQTYKMLAYDSYGDGWNNGLYSLSRCWGSTVANNGGITPDDFNLLTNLESTEFFYLDTCFKFDVSIAGITPIGTGCAPLTTAESVEVTVFNRGSGAVSSVPVSLIINGGAPVLDNIPGPIASGTSTAHTFSTTADLSAFRYHNVDASVNYPGDEDPSNNSQIILAASGDREVIVEVASGNFPDEVYWEIYDSANGYLIYHHDPYVVKATFRDTLCLGEGNVYYFNAFDVFGDGWNGGKYKVYYNCNGIVQLADNNGQTPDNLSSGTNDLEVSERFTVPNCYNVDIKAKNLILPPSGCLLSDTEWIDLNILNNSSVDLDSIIVTLVVGSTTVTDTIFATIPLGNTYLHTFSQSFDFSTTDVYPVSSWVSYSGDLDLSNDSLSGAVVVGNVEAYVNVFGGSYGVEIFWFITDSLTGAVVASDSIYPDGINTIDTICLLEGRTFVMSAWDSWSDGWNGGTYEISICNGSLILANNGGAVPDNGTMVPVPPGNDLEAVEPFTVGSCISDDVRMVAVDSPAASCSLSSAETIIVIVRNSGTNTQVNVPVFYRVDGGAVIADTITDTLFSSLSTPFSFGVTADLSAQVDHTIEVWAGLAGDMVPDNDTIAVVLPYKQVQTVCLYDEGMPNCPVFSPNLCADGFVQGNTSLITSPPFQVSSSVIDSLAILLYYTDCEPGDEVKFDIYLNDVLLGSYLDTTFFCNCFPMAETWPRRLVFTDSALINSLVVCGFNYIGIKHDGKTTATAGYVAEFYGECTPPKTGADVGVSAVVSPNIGCLGMEAIRVEVTNYGDAAQDTIPVAYQVNGGAVERDTIWGRINGLVTKAFTFSKKVDMSLPLTYDIKAWTEFSTDGLDCNDSVTGYTAQSYEPIIVYPHREGFDSTGLPDNWKVENPDNFLTWSPGRDNGGNDAFSVQYFYYIDSGQVDRMLSALFDLQAVVNPVLKFKVSYRQYGGSDNTLRVWVSTDCGMTFDTIPLYEKTGATLATGTPHFGNWVPTNFSDWREEIISLSGYAGSGQVIIAFEGVAQSFFRGGNLWIDDVTITPTPVNDNCIAPVNIPADSVTIVKGNALYATKSREPVYCNSLLSFISEDVWFDFTADTTALNIVVQPSASFNAVVELLDDSCGGNFNSLACADAQGDGIQEIIRATGLTAGTEYYVRVYHYGNTSPATTEFDIYIYKDELPLNDDCELAITLAVKDSCEPRTGIANGTAYSVGCVGNSLGDVWYKFTAPQPNVFVRVDGYQDFDAVVEVFDSCNGNLLYCEDKTFKGETEIVAAQNLLTGNTYMVRVFDFDTPTVTSIIFDICITKTNPSFVPDPAFAGRIAVYPNPFTDELTIQYRRPGLRMLRIELMRVSGEIVNTVHLVNLKDEWNGSLNFKEASLTSGVYVLRLQDGLEARTEKVVLMK